MTTEADTRERRRRRAVRFYELMFDEDRPREAVERFVGDTYTQHNPHVEDGKEAFGAYFERMAEAYPDKKATIHRTVVEDDLVVLHCEQSWPGDEDYAGIDIFRFDEDDRIVEHWDVLQPIPDEMAHDNGMF
jgi:predicted SnoaL-like aldol condensation-catalyzing enzyme